MKLVNKEIKVVNIKKALSGEYKNFTGISDVYEEPKHAEIIIDTDKTSVEDATKEIVKLIRKKYIT